MNPGAGPEQVMQAAMSFQPAKLVLTGVELGLFRLLAERPRTAGEICAELGLHGRGAANFLAALVATGMLDSDGGTYRNSEPVEAALVPGATAYLGGFLEMAGRVMYPAWSRLGESLRTGEPQAATYSGGDMFDQLYGDEAERGRFVSMAEDASRPLIPVLAKTFDWRPYGSVLELGGCRGNVLAGIVREHPHLSATVLDLPPLAEPFRAHMAALGTSGKVRFHGADFFADELPRADVVMIGHCMVDWTDEQRRTLIDRVFPAVEPGGVFLIWDPMLVEGDESYLRNLFRSLNLQLMTPHGTNYRLADCRRWLSEAGFAEVRHTPLGHDVTLVIAEKAR